MKWWVDKQYDCMSNQSNDQRATKMIKQWRIACHYRLIWLCVGWRWMMFERLIDELWIDQISIDDKMTDRGINEWVMNEWRNGEHSRRNKEERFWIVWKDQWLINRWMMERLILMGIWNNQRWKVIDLNSLTKNEEYSDMTYVQTDDWWSDRMYWWVLSHLLKV